MKVVLAEDDRKLRSLLSQILRPMGGDIVFECGTQFEAITWLEGHHDGWDLAVVNLFLAEGNGFALLRHCETRSPAQKVVMISNYVREPVAARACEAGADAFFDKSSQMEDFIEYCLAVRQSLPPNHRV
ncbi:response regulator [Variovorax sp. J22P271]|uniref:response regulator n=1 Tax=Variovorax davisae TaxID=3053515 RepID=UPI002577A412|nr:response regulator [Variovorax sp. J22P271]MDM0032170.1 response regulator [Variovorax sp. J22P271]